MGESQDFKFESALVAGIAGEDEQQISPLHASLGVTLAAILPHVEIVSDASKYFDGENRRHTNLVVLCDWLAHNEGRLMVETFRKNSPLCLLMIVGAKDSSVEQAEHAYAVGADNYFSYEEACRAVRARVKTLISQSASENSSDALNGNELIQIEDLQLWPKREVAMRAGTPIKLSQKEAAILKCLATNKRKPVSRQKLLREAFGLKFEPGTNVVEVHIHRLRRKIDSGFNKCLLSTVRGFGYTLG